MKKFILTIVAFVAMSTTSFAQYSSLDIDEIVSIIRSSNLLSNPSVSYCVPSVSYSSPSVSYDIPTLSQSTINALTTTVNSYYRSNGTFVDSYVRTMPNNTNWDNFSTKGNFNPYTGSTGSRARDYSIDALNYGAGHTIHTGSRGGQYYINSQGNRTYVPKRNLW